MVKLYFLMCQPAFVLLIGYVRLIKTGWTVGFSSRPAKRTGYTGQSNGTNPFCHIKVCRKVVTCITIPAKAFSRHESQTRFSVLRPRNDLSYLENEVDLRQLEKLLLSPEKQYKCD